MEIILINIFVGTWDEEGIVSTLLLKTVKVRKRGSMYFCNVSGERRLALNDVFVIFLLFTKSNPVPSEVTEVCADKSSSHSERR